VEARGAGAAKRKIGEALAGTAHPALVPVAPVTAPAAAGDGATRRSSLRQAYSLAAALRGMPERRFAIVLAAGVVAVIVANMVAQVRLNAWHGDFFNAIERKSLPDVGRQLLLFLGIAAVLLVFVVAQTWLHELLKVRLRAMLSRRLLDDWLLPGRAYRLGIASAAGVNPDQRMQEDVRNLSELSADLGIGLIHHAFLLGSFVGVLWLLSAGIAIPIGGDMIAIPGYMVWCALAYAGAGSWLAWRIGRPLVQLNVDRYAREAELRFALVRVSESAESVGLYGGERDERRLIDATLGNVLEAMRRVAFAVARLTWITSGYGWIAIVVPTVVALPGYFYGGLTLGGLMMVVGAFNQVQQALRWFVDNYARIADWRAALHRVSEFRAALNRVDDIAEDESRIVFTDHPLGRLSFEDVSVLLADGKVIIKEASAEISPGERVLIVGESGSGKSTLFRALAGLWPWGSGTVRLPPRASMMFMPQRPYLPLGTLGAAATYPAPPDAFAADIVAAAMKRVGLADLVPLLDDAERWDKLLSMGQQQRLAFARMLLHRPKWVFLDEATSALDEESQERVMSIFEHELASAAVVSVGHRPGLDRFHTRTLQLETATEGAQLRRRRTVEARRPRKFTMFPALFSRNPGARRAPPDR
jgi:putative ATP-binding cassette transporter